MHDQQTSAPHALDRRFMEVMDAAPVMIWMSGEDKGCVWFNQPWLTFTGRSIAQELGSGWTAGVHPDDYERCLEIYIRHFEDRQNFRMQYRLRRQDGVYCWIDDIGMPRYARDGTFLGYIGSCVDVTPSKATEAALLESEARLRVATNSANLGVFERNIREDRVVWVNDRMYEIFGRSPQDGPLTREVFLRQYLHPDDVRAFENAMKTAIETDGHLHVTCRIRRKNGEERWLQVDGTYQFTDTGEPLRLIGVAADITNRKKLEQHAAELSGRLVNVQEEERQRVAQELHDSTAQHLVATSLHLMSLRPTKGLTPEETRRWDEAEASLQEAEKEIRAYSYLMHPPALQADKLVASLNQYIRGFNDRTNIEVNVRMSPKLDKLPFEMQRTFLRIAQEALANVHRHAEASQAFVRGRIVGGQVHLVIGDDGRGIRFEQDTTVGRGIRGMEDRAQRWGGTLRIRNGYKGTNVHAAWPVR
jgi:PAS domain S-box-containing protein